MYVIRASVPQHVEIRTSRLGPKFLEVCYVFWVCFLFAKSKTDFHYYFLKLLPLPRDLGQLNETPSDKLFRGQGVTSALSCKHAQMQQRATWRHN
jgi:hypothetical protein